MFQEPKFAADVHTGFVQEMIDTGAEVVGFGVAVGCPWEGSVVAALCDGAFETDGTALTVWEGVLEGWVGLGVTVGVPVPLYMD